MNFFRVFVIAVVLFYFVGCDDGSGSGGSGDTSNSTITFKAVDSTTRSRSVDLGTDGDNIDGMIFQAMRGMAFQWDSSSSDYTFQIPDYYFFQSGGFLFSPSAPFSETIDSSQIPTTVDCLAIQLDYPTVSVNGETYSQSEQVGYDALDHMNYVATDHQSVLQIVDGSGNVLVGNDDYSFDLANKGVGIFERNLVIFLNPAVLPALNSGSICGTLEAGSVDWDLVSLDGSGYGSDNTAIQAFIDAIGDDIYGVNGDGYQRSTYVSIIPMTPINPWADGEVKIEMTSDFTHLLYGIDQSGDTNFEPFAATADGSYLSGGVRYEWSTGDYVAPTCNWETPKGYQYNIIDSVVMFSIDSDCLALPWDIDIK